MCMQHTLQTPKQHSSHSDHSFSLYRCFTLTPNSVARPHVFALNCTSRTVIHSNRSSRCWETNAILYFLPSVCILKISCDVYWNIRHLGGTLERRAIPNSMILNIIVEATQEIKRNFFEALKNIFMCRQLGNAIHSHAQNLWWNCAA